MTVVFASYGEQTSGDVCLFYCHLKTPVTSIYKCTCHILTLVILFIVTTTINVVFFALSSCRRTELNCGNKENERESRFCSSILSFFSLSVSFAFNEQNKREASSRRERESEKR